MCELHDKSGRTNGKIIPVNDAIGTILAHDITEITPGTFKGRAFRKGHVIRQEDICHLRRLGKENLFVLDLADDEMHDVGTVGVLHGAKSYVLQDDAGQILGTHSIAAGLDYPGVGPEHSYYKSIGRATYVAVNDKEALKAFQLLCRTEGIIPALEPAHAISYAFEIGRLSG